MLSDSLELLKLKKILRKINKLKPKMRAMSDEQLQNQTKVLRQKLKSGKNVLVEAYATMREADYRVLGLFPYDVQVIGAIVLDQGSIAEMKTGEGKTLTATMPLYLNALSGEGAMLVTTNQYLSQRDKETLAPVYEWMGLTVSNAFKTDDLKEEVTPALKRKWYAADIIYTTASSLAFDYLFNNLAANKEGQYLRPFNYVLIDEVDEVLLDEAQSPFVVSSSPSLQSNLYNLADQFVRLLAKNRDYKIQRDSQLVWLTYFGVKKAEKYFRIANLFDESNREIYRHIILALKAHLFMINGHDYVVLQQKVILLDENDGRLKKGIQISTGLHQAIETKEHVELTTIQKTAATITFPSLFSLFKKVSGMSGTAKVNENEFLDIYNMKVVEIPTRKPVIRKDYPPVVFLTTKDKLMAAINKILAIHKTGRPILLVAGSVENSEVISELLLNYGIPHNVLNAFNEVREAEIVKNAGKEGAVTVATNMAGRGTDIKLGPGVKEKGGLAVIGTEMLSPRVKLQLAGRAGRQGDPGTSQFFVSMEDKYVSRASTKRQKKYYRRLLRKKKSGKDIVILRNPITRLGLLMLQNRVEANGATSRIQTNKYEIALGLQRKNLYHERNQIMNSPDLQKFVDHLIDEVIDLYLNSEKKWDSNKVKKLIDTHFTYQEVKVPANLTKKSEIKKYLRQLSHRILQVKAKTLINEQQLNQFYHKVILAAIDQCWINQVDFITNLRIYTQPWSYSGRDPDYIYERDAYNAFLKMQKQEKFSIMDGLLLSPIYINDKGQLIVQFM